MRAPPTSSARASWIPNKHIAKGFPPNVMPKTFGSSLSKKDLDDLVTYLSGNSK